MPVEKLEPKRKGESVEAYLERVKLHKEKVARHENSLRLVRSKIHSLSENG